MSVWLVERIREGYAEWAKINRLGDGMAMVDWTDDANKAEQLFEWEAEDIAKQIPGSQATEHVFLCGPCSTSASG